MTETIITKFHCEKCNKYYTGQSGLWMHNKVCKRVEQSPNQEKLIEMITGMNEQLNKLTEEVKNNKPTALSLTTINNTNNINTFNMNIFLNETCNNAINFEEFIKNLIFEHADSKLMIDSYVEGTCNIIWKNYL